jgi:poly(hydroxyalkanoate) depolymerase family esterase
MNETVANLMREATRLTQSGRLTAATDAIQRALNGAIKPTPAHAPAGVGAKVETTADRTPVVIDGVVLCHGTMPEVQKTIISDDKMDAAGEFVSGVHTAAGLTRRYKLYVPPGHVGRALPLIVMLHGCTQDPDDFATGTGMNEHAQQNGFFVLYPAQAQDANPQRCWNWFKHTHQARGRGEPALIADLTLAVTSEYGIDAQRVYVAGMSAGGAMAAITATAYPEIFAAVGVHSGLPVGAARNVSEALSAMKSGKPMALGIAPSDSSPAVPVIVFHGDQDQTVHCGNGEQIFAAALGGQMSRGNTAVEQGVSAAGRKYTRSRRHGPNGETVAEHWLVHGAGHAWSGGRAGGSYTDARGPDASAEMLRFFFEHQHVRAS